MAGSSLFSNLARGAKLLALLLFLLPFVTVSCSVRDGVRAMGNEAASLPPALANAPDCTVITASGLQLAMGSAQTSRDCPETIGKAVGTTVPESESGASDDHPFKDPNIAVIAAAALILLALLATFLLKGTAAVIAGAGGCLLAACAIVYAVIIQAPGVVRDSILRGGLSSSGTMPGGAGGPKAAQIDQMIHTGPGIGFWLVLVALLAAIALNVMAMRTPGPAAPPPAV